VGETTYDSIRRTEIDVDPSLNVEFSPENSGDSYAFDITYPNGGWVSDNSLIAVVESKTFTLLRDGDYYWADLIGISGKEAVIVVVDSCGNAGKTEFVLNRPFDFLAVIILLILVALSLLFQKKIRLQVVRNKERSAERRALEKRKKQLEEMIEDTRKRFYKQSVSEEYAKSKIADYEEELKLLNEELESIKPKPKQHHHHKG